MASSEYRDNVEIAASLAAHIQGNSSLEPADERVGIHGSSIPVLDTSDIATRNGQRLLASKTWGAFCNLYAWIRCFVLTSYHFFSPKKQEQTTSTVERPLKVQTAITLEPEGPSENTSQCTLHQQSPENEIILDLESMPMPVQGTESPVKSLEQSPTSETPLELGPATSISDHNMPDELPSHSNSTPPECPGQLQAIPDTPSTVVFTSTREQSRRKVVLKDIFIECSSLHHFHDDLMLVVVRNGRSEYVPHREISATKRKVVEDIDLNIDTGYMTLIVRSKEGDYEVFLEFTVDEIWTMACAEGDIPAEHEFAAMDGGNLMSIKMFSTVAVLTSSRSQQSRRKLLLKDIFLECLSPHDEDDFMLAIVWKANVEDLHLTKISPTKWKVFEDIDLHHEPRSLMLIVHSKDKGVEASCQFNRDEIWAMVCAEEGTPAEHVFASAKEDNPISVRMSSTVALSSDFGLRAKNRAMLGLELGVISDLHRGLAFQSRFEEAGNIEDITETISLYECAISSFPPGHHLLSATFNDLGNSYSSRFERTGNTTDSERAISHYQSAVESVPSGHVDLPGRLANLGGSYLSRFKYTRNLEDIDRAILHGQRAVESTASEDVVLPNRLNNLGNSYTNRFRQTGNLPDIDHAILLYQRSIELTPSGDANLLGRLSNLGNSYTFRFEHSNDLQDIDCAISHHQTAIKSAPSGHVELSNYFNNLGLSYKHRFAHTGDLQDIDHAIYYTQTAIKSPPSSQIDLSGRLTNLGNCYDLRFISTRDFPDVQNSIASYRKAAEANSTPYFRLQSAKDAALLSSVHDESHCLSDFALAISLLSEVAGLEQTIDRRYTNLHNLSDLMGPAVTTALKVDRPDLALEWLEQGRCLVWNQLNQLRTPIDNLSVNNPFLANRFIRIASSLDSYGTRVISSIPPSHAPFAVDIRNQDDTQNHTIRATEYTQLLKEIRSLPGYHNFLQPPKAGDLLSSLPSDGSVIIFNIQETRCNALAIMAGCEGPLHIPLENFSLKQAEELQRTLQSSLLNERKLEDQDRAIRVMFDNPRSMSSVLKALWCNVIQPILKALGYSEFPPNPSDRRRIWWCPTGPLTSLPLHAAGIYGSAYKPGSCISDFVVSSYTPTIRSLNDKFVASSTSFQSTNLVLISQPNTPGFTSIPSTRKETHDLEVLLKGNAINALLLEDSKGTREQVKEEMKSHSWVHFACHGVQDVKKPLESGLCLHDGRLELLEIMKLRISNPHFAFLSACQTSKGDVKLSEEAVHLAAGMLAAGYRGVVGTMWSISDMHGPEFAMEFYQYLLRERGSMGLDSTQAAYALDYATRKVRKNLGESETAFLTWVPYVHFGY